MPVAARFPVDRDVGSFVPTAGRPKSSLGQPAAAIIAIALCCWLDRFGLLDDRRVQLTLVGVAVLTALPHGGADLAVGARLLKPRIGRAWLPAFGAAYLAPASAMVAAWWIAPGWALAFFLALSVLHFGLSDTSAQDEHRLLGILTLGSAPIIIPALAHSTTLADLFTAIAGAEGAILIDVLRGPLGAAWMLVAAVFSTQSLLLGSHRQLLNAAIACTAFIVLPPLPAFAIYFGVIHSPRALAARAVELGEPMLGVLRSAAAPSIAAALAIAGAGLALSTVFDLDRAALIATFVGLAALTVPHMLLDGSQAVRSARSRVPDGTLWLGAAERSSP